jgi:uncharacterized Fe-S cluster-containing radical SAM superfamily protein
LKDLWSNSEQYRAECQTPDDVQSTLLPHRADCWTYAMNDVNDRQRALIARHDAAERLRLRQADDGRWAVDFHWPRVLARKA